jgi:hypothetical protein
MGQLNIKYNYLGAGILNRADLPKLQCTLAVELLRGFYLICLGVVTENISVF